MKTKEIEVYLNKESLDSLLEDETYTVRMNRTYEKDDVKAKLIIELPEKKVEITESQFEVAFLSNHPIYDENWLKEIRRVKQKLFGDAK